MVIKRDKVSKKGLNGQSLTEFSFLLPILFLIFLVILQLAVLLVKNVRTQMSVWPALRGPSIPKVGGDGGWHSHKLCLDYDFCILYVPFVGCVKSITITECITYYLPDVPVIPYSRYSEGDMRNEISRNMFGSNDSVELDYSDAKIVDKILSRVEVVCRTPFLFKGLDWKPIREIFVPFTSGGETITLKAKGEMIKDIFSLWSSD